MKVQSSLTAFLITIGCIAVILFVLSETATAKPTKQNKLKDHDKKALKGGDQNALKGGDKKALKGGDKKALKGGDKKALKGGDKKALKGGDKKALKQHDDTGYPTINSVPQGHYKCFNGNCKHPPPPEPIVQPFTPTILEQEISKNRKEYENSPGSVKHVDRVKDKKDNGTLIRSPRQSAASPECDDDNQILDATGEKDSTI